jgi:lipopolysaccharide/colanic/teichoic acid biosynthesis glycosyltransferase
MVTAISLPSRRGIDRAKTVSPNWQGRTFADRTRTNHVISRRTDALVERTGSPVEIVPTHADEPDAAPLGMAAEENFVVRASRMLNVVLAAAALFLALPLLLLIAIAIKLTSWGPVLYTQERVGLDRRTPGDAARNHRRVRDIGGTPFTIYKFRTMRVDAEALSGAVWATQDDPRVTPVGRFLRQYRLDEIPQLLNVMRGEMNIVGPRPERPTIFAELREHIKEYPQRQRAKPGITGLAQIYHHYDRSLDDVRTKVRFDLEYIRRQSLLEDLRIMLRTIPVILFRRGGW